MSGDHAVVFMLTAGLMLKSRDTYTVTGGGGEELRRSTPLK